MEACASPACEATVGLFPQETACLQSERGQTQCDTVYRDYYYHVPTGILVLPKHGFFSFLWLMNVLPKHHGCKVIVPHEYSAVYIVTLTDQVGI